MLKSILKKTLRTFGVGVRHIPRPLVKTPEAEFRFTFEHIVLSHFCREPDFFFVQIGANDGSTVDPLYSMVERFDWPGLLIEPEELAYQRLCQTYRDKTRLQFANVAIADYDGEGTLHVVNPEVPDPLSRGPLISSLDRQTAIANLGFDGDGVLFPRKVQVCRLATLLEQRKIDRVDLLQIDAEGYDFKIIQSLEGNEAQPQIINYEHALLSRRDKEACWNLLIRRGYQLFVHEPDTTAIRAD
ncbi:MAG TPA: FkbM family methyltransferase [Chthoniobacteraceae bacterium]|jgi:FkbM family methyltransferase